MCSIVWWVRYDSEEHYDVVKLRPSELAHLQSQQGELDAKWGFPIEIEGVNKLVINGRSETLEEKKMFEPHLPAGRAVIEVQRYGEWEHFGKEKLLWEFSSADDQPLHLACLVRKPGEFVILTCAPNSLAAQAHDRMPCVLSKEQIPAWLEGKVDEALAQLRPYDASKMKATREEPVQPELF